MEKAHKTNDTPFPHHEWDQIKKKKVGSTADQGYMYLNCTKMALNPLSPGFWEDPSMREE